MRSAVLFLWLIVISATIDLLSGAAQNLSNLKTLSLGLLSGPLVVCIDRIPGRIHGGKTGNTSFEFSIVLSLVWIGGGEGKRPISVLPRCLFKPRFRLLRCRDPNKAYLQAPCVLWL